MSQKTSMFRFAIREIIVIILLSGGLFLSLHLISLFDWGQGKERALLILLIALFVGLLASLSPPKRPSSWLSKGFVALLCAGSLFYHTKDARYYARQGTGLIDIITITLDAGEHLLQGHNPYKQKIDTQWPNPRYQGFKYSPLMILFYLPARWLGSHGVVFLNYSINLTIALLLFLICRREIGSTAGLLASAIYLAIPLVSYETYNHGANDIIGTAFVLCSLLCLRYPALAGLFIGLSISTKLMPGVLCAVAFLPRRGFFKYVGGCLLGLVPIFLLLALSPKAFLDNVVYFPLSRMVDTTSWLYGQSRWVIKATKLAFVGVAFLTLLLAFFLQVRAKTRILLSFFLLTASLFNSAAVHRNYFLWWIPILILALLLSVYPAVNQEEPATI